MPENRSNETRNVRRSRIFRRLLLFLGFSVVATVAIQWWASIPLPNPGRFKRYPYVWGGKPFTNNHGREVEVAYYWDRSRATNKFRISGAGHSNLRSADYLGPDACRACHGDKYGDWTNHSHKNMNQIATPESVLADFDGSATIAYLGGHARFYQTNALYRMDLWRDGKTNRFIIERTIGSRFFQRYTGRLEDPIDSEQEGEFVLPFSWWIDRHEWVPATHIFPELDSDEEHWDPFDEPFSVSYDTGCAECHTTIPYGEVLLRQSGYNFVSEYVPRSFHFGFSNALAAAPVSSRLNSDEDPEFTRILDTITALNRYSTREHAASLGISCEACHYGAREHVENSTQTESSVLPRFFPSDPDLFVDAKSEAEAFGRNVDNKNFICGRCHIGGRPEFASGHHTWNSTEYSEAIAGYCYKSTGKPDLPRKVLSCVRCHDPHIGTGKTWSRTRAQDNQSCLDCHGNLKATDALMAHTHHQADSVGSDCMNCHMPKINEGLQDMVRTHRIFSPTEPSMIEANQPNACNMCHVEQGIDWTLKHLKDWYGQEYDSAKIASVYSDQPASVAHGWTRSEHPATRLVASDVLVKARARWALSTLVEQLDDSHLTNRQLLQRWLEEWLGTDLAKLGYRAHQMPHERQTSLTAVKKALLPTPVKTAGR